MQEDLDKNPQKDSKAVKGIAIGMISFAFIIIALLFAVDLFLEPYLIKKAEEKVSKSSDGLYSLNIQELEFKWFSLSFLAKGLSFTTDSSKYLNGAKSSGKPFIDIKIRSSRIKNINPLPFLWGNNIKVDEVNINHPLIYIANPIDNEAAPSGGKDFSISQLLSKNIFPLKIDEVNLNHGNLLYRQNSGRTKVIAKNFNFSTPNVNLGKKEDEKVSVFSKDFKLEVNGNLQLLKDKFYKFRVEKLIASTKDGIVAKGIVFKTDSSEFINVKADERPYFSYYNITSPLFIAEIKNWEAPLDGKPLNFSNITVKNPNVKIVAFEENVKKHKDKFLTFHRDIEKFIPGIKMDTFYIEDGRVQYVHRDEPRKTVYEAKDFYLTFFDVHIDSASAVDTNRILYSKKAKLIVKDYFKIFENIYSLKVNYLEVNTDKGILIKGAVFKTDSSQYAKLPPKEKLEKSLYRVAVPEMNIKYTDWGNLLKGGEIYIPLAEIIRPDVFIATSKQNVKSHKSAIAKMDESFSKYIERLKFDSIILKNGNFQYKGIDENQRPVILAQDFNLSVYDILVDTGAVVNKNRILYSDKFKLLVQGKFKYKGEEFLIQSDYLYASTGYGVIAKDLRVESLEDETKDPIQFDSHISEAYLKIPDLIKLLNGQPVEIANARIVNPVTEIVINRDIIQKKDEKSKSSNLDILYSSSLKKLLVQDGKVDLAIVNNNDTTRFTIKDFGFTVKNLGFENKKLKVSDIAFNNLNIEVKDPIKIDSKYYTISVKEINFKDKSNIILNDLSVVSDSLVLNISDKPYISIDVPQISLKIASLGDILEAFINKDKGVDISKISIKRPLIEIVSNGFTSQDSSGNSASSKILSYIPALKISETKINDGKITYTAQDSAGNSIYKINNFDLAFYNTLLDSNSIKDKNRILFTKDIHLNAHNFSSILGNDLYSVSMEKVEARTEKGTLSIHEFSLQPRYSLNEFFNKPKSENDMVNFNFRKLEGEEVDFNRLVEKGDIVADKIKVDKFNILANYDRSKPKVSPSSMFIDEFKNLNTYVKINTVNINKGYIRYTEISKKDIEPGSIYFTSVSGDIYNITNDSLLVSKSNPIVLKTEGEFMGEGQTQLYVEIPVFNDQNYFTATGSIGAMNLTALNPSLARLAFLCVESGKLYSLFFKIDAGKKGAQGIMCASYKNFEVEILDKDPELEDKYILSFLANNLIINNDNIIGKRSFKSGKICLEREENSNVFNYFWKSFRSGIYDTLNVPENPNPISILKAFFKTLN